VLGLGLRELKEAATELPAAAQELLQQRQTAREQKDWAQSDALRDTLLQMGYEVLDSATGQQLRPIRPAAGTDQ
jgi:cysteinyl-tRNA synthetase